MNGRLRARAEGTPASREDPLERVVGVRALALNAINLTVGAGIVGLPSAIASELGGWAFLAYLVCAALVVLVCLCFAEAGSRVVGAGGLYAYVREAFGPAVGAVCGIVFFVAQGCVANAAIVSLFLEMVSRFVPALRERTILSAVIIGFYGALATLHTRWLRGGLGAAVTLTVVKLLPLVLVGLGVFTLGLPAELVTGPAPDAERLGHAAVILMFAFIGIEGALSNGSEIRAPARTVPRGVFLAVAVVVALYLALHLAAQRALGPSLAGAGGNALTETAATLFGSAAGLVVTAGVLISLVAIAVGDLFSLPRIPYALGRHGVLPRMLGAVHPRFHTPHVAIGFYSALACLFALTGTFRQLAVFGVSGTLVVYLAACLGVLELRRKGVAQAGRPFVVPGGPVVPLLAALAVIGLLASLERRELWALAALVALSGGVYLARHRIAGRVSPDTDDQ